MEVYVVKSQIFCPTTKVGGREKNAKHQKRGTGSCLGSRHVTLQRVLSMLDMNVHVANRRVSFCDIIEE